MGVDRSIATRTVGEPFEVLEVEGMGFVVRLLVLLLLLIVDTEFRIMFVGPHRPIDGRRIASVRRACRSGRAGGGACVRR